MRTAPYPGFQPRLVVMLKAPKIGRAKTRLARDIGSARASAFYRKAVTKLLKELGGDPRWETILAVDPVSVLEQGWEKLWPEHLPRVSQGSGGLGDRMRLQFAALPPGPVMIIGSDAPSISTEMIAHGFQKLRGHDAVLGPAIDGGYWLIGLKRLRAAPDLFSDVRWSTEHTLTDTLATLPPADQFSRVFLQPLMDIDEEADLKAQPQCLQQTALIQLDPVSRSVVAEK